MKLDQNILEQLKNVFAPLNGEIALIYDESSHADQEDLIGLLQDVASTHPQIKTQSSGQKTTTPPSFKIHYNGNPNGIIFRGIPGGHEFSSLVLAILNSDKKGKLPDDFLIKRIQKLKGPIHVRTYMSLDCENCPDVVQQLNQITILHGNFKHEIIDGAHHQEEIQKYNIQGVPCVMTNDQLIHSGRIQLLDLLTKLEDTFGVDKTKASSQEKKNIGHFDVVVIGGGPAGSSAAIYSVRKGLSTAIITEKIGGQVQETKGIENLIGTIYTEGPALSDALQKHISSYPVQILENRRVFNLRKENHKIHMELESGETLTAQATIIATGAKWRELGIHGEKEYIGRGVAFCPHCDGPFYKNKKVAVIGGGNSGVEAAIDLAGVVKEVILFEYNDTLKADAVLVKKLKSLSNVSVITSAATKEILGDGQKVTTLQYLDRKTEKKIDVPLDGVFVQIGLVPNTQFLKDTLKLSKFGEIITDEKGRTSVPGIYAAGDVTTTPYKQIIIAMGEGAKTALAAYEDQFIKGT